MTEQPEDFDDLPGGFVPRLVKKFLDSPLSIMLLLISLLLGALALLITPEEEDPQIVVPIADVFIKVPGVGAAEVEKLVSTPLEQLLWQIDGVEYVYSTSAEESSIVTVRFFVGEDRERSLVKLYNKINSNLDLVPPIVKEWIIKPIEIDDVSILNAAIHSSEYTTNELRRIGVEAISRLQEVKNISRTSVIGGMNDLVRVEPREEALKARKISFEDLSRTLRAANSQINAGAIKWNNSSYLVQTGPDLRNASDIEKIVVGVFDNKPVYLADVAEVINLPDYPTHFTRILSKDGDKVIVQPAVTLALAKKKGDECSERGI